MKSIPILDLKKQYKSIKSEIDKRILKTLASQGFILGEETEKFEREFAKYCGKKYCIGLGSGTDALLVALKIMGIKEGDEVIVPAFTFIATAEAVTMLGGKVVFCDIDPTTGLIDTKNFTRRLTSKTRFVIPVDLYGQLAPIDKIIKIISGRNIQIIADSAQAHGASYKNNKSPLAQIAAYSFYPAKNLGAYGDAGALVTTSSRLYQQALFLRNHGQKPGKKYLHSQVGYNFRIDEIQAAVLRVKLKYMDRWNNKRRKIANLYNKRLNGIKGLELIKTLSSNVHVYHQYAIKVKKRDALQSFLKQNAIETRVHYPLPLHLQPAYKYLEYKKGDFPGAENLSQEVLCLPMFPELSQKEAFYVIDKIKEYYYE